MSRTLFITYGDLTLGLNQTDPNYNLVGKFFYDQDYERATLRFEVIISGSTSLSFENSEAALFAAYRKPDQALTVNLADRRISLVPSTNTGFNARANCQKVPGPDNTDRSSRYECEVIAQLPADLAGRAGRQSSTVDVSSAPNGKRTTIVSGVYTALSNNAARAQFEAEIDAYTTSVLGALSGTWEQIGEPTAQTDDQDKTIRFSRVFREILVNQSSTGLDNASIVEPQLLIRRVMSANDSTQSSASLYGTPDPEIEYDVTYSAIVRFDETTNLDNLWKQTLRNFIITKVRESTGSTSLVITQESTTFDVYENRLNASMRMLGNVGGVMFASATMSESKDEGKIFLPVYDGGEGFTRDKYSGPKTHVRSMTIITVSRDGEFKIDKLTNWPSFSLHDFEGWIGDGHFELIRTNKSARKWTRGVPGLRADTANYIMRRTVHTFLRVDFNTGAAGAIGPGPDAPPSSNGTTRERKRKIG